MALDRWLPASLMVVLGAWALGGCGGRDDPPALPSSAYESTTPTPLGLGVTGVGASQGRPPPVTPTPAPATGAWVGQAEMFRGDLGEVRAFAGVRSLVTGSDAGDASHVRLDAEDSAAGWWAMTRLTLGGTLQHRDLRPGARLTFTGGSCPGTTLRVTALGCSGPLRDDARFDHPAEQVTVAVSAGPTASTQRMDFTASFRSPAGSQQVAGSFIYEVGVAR